MDRFLFAHNPLKPAGPIGLQGYIVDTVKGVWIAVDIVPEGYLPQDVPKFKYNIDVFGPMNMAHHLTIAKNIGNAKPDIQSITEAANWYDEWLQLKGVEVKVYVSFAQPNPA